METLEWRLLQEAKKQWVLRMSSTGLDGRHNLTAENALRILQICTPIMEKSGFPKERYWMLK